MSGSGASGMSSSARRRGAEGSLQGLAVSPLVTVMPVIVTPTTPAVGGGTATTPAGDGGTATTPAGGGTTPTPAGGGTATTPAGTVKTTHPAIDWPPIILLVIGLILAAAVTVRIEPHASAAVTTIEESQP